MITWIQDYNIIDPSVGGGAQLTDRLIMLEGLKRQYYVVLMTPETWDEEVIKESDIVIISISRRFTKEQMNIITKKPYVVFMHDYWCKWILYYPQLPKCKKCKYLDKDFYLNSETMIWLSPAHRDAWLYAFEELKNHDYFLNPSAVDVDRFYSLHKKPNTAVACNQLKFKGRDNVLKYIKEHPEIKFYIYGAVENPDEYPSNVELVGNIAYTQLPKFLSDKEYAIHLPSTVQPCERFAIEAIASKCKPIFNENVGITSYKEYKEGRLMKLIRKTPSNFWSNLESRFTF